mmetsp:Transcript_9272/g.22975  ORF Transcript_9272/g.22975 Transcript_9272/m.22975 type:complete len:305 (+) Transcript_9272:527-1441(+)
MSMAWLLEEVSLDAPSALRYALELSTAVPPRSTRMCGLRSFQSATARASSYVVPPTTNTMTSRGGVRLNAAAYASASSWLPAMKGYACASSLSVDRLVSVAVSSGVCCVYTLSTPCSPLNMVLALFMMERDAYRSPARRACPAARSTASTPAYSRGSLSLRPRPCRNSIIWRTRSASPSNRRQYSATSRALSLSVMPGWRARRMMSSALAPALTAVAGLASSCSISDTSSRLRLDTVSLSSLIRLTCLITLPCRRWKSMCSIMKRRMSSRLSTLRCLASVDWYCSMSALTLRPTSPKLRPACLR